MNVENYNVLQNNGRVAHQVVDHVGPPPYLVWAPCGGVLLGRLGSTDFVFRCISIWLTLLSSSSDPIHVAKSPADPETE